MTLIERKYFRAILFDCIMALLFNLLFFEPCQATSYFERNINPDSIELRKMLEEFSILIGKKDYKSGEKLCNRIETLVDTTRISDRLLLSDACYTVGVFYYFLNDMSLACKRFEEAALYRKESGVVDERYADIINNAGMMWFNLGDYSNALKYGKRNLALRRKLFWNDTTNLVLCYINLASINLQLYDFENALKNAEAGLAIYKLYPDKVDPSSAADLYQDIALGLYRSGENAKALVYATEALRLYAPYDSQKADSWGLMFNTVILIYKALNQPDMAEKFFKLGLEHSTPENVSSTYYLSTNYARFLELRNQPDHAEKILLETIHKIENGHGKNNPEYAIVTSCYASFLFNKDKNPDRATNYYLKCFDYIKSHSWDVLTREAILVGYGQMLYKTKHYSEAIEIFNMILNPYHIETYASVDNLQAKAKLSDSAIEAMSMKYKALNELARQTDSRTYTLLAIKTGEILTSIIDRKRLEMSEEESRTNLSDSSRIFYTDLIANYCSLYNSEKNPYYLKKAFEFSEKSKAAGFLASTRQLKATRFSLPDKLADKDRDLGKRIGLYREFISREKSTENPDSNKIATWERINFNLIRSRDSLAEVFENDYPDFYKLKFNSKITTINDVTGVIGPKENLLSYVMTDDKLYIFIINKLHKELIVKDIDSLFHSRLERFRSLVSTIPSGNDARASFNEYMVLANELYLTLIDPAKPYLVGNRLTISPDGILSYIPFEGLITERYESNDLLYRNAPYVLKNLRLSYIYSVTLSSETRELRLHLRNRVAAFAPTYANRELSDSIQLNFPNLKGRVPDLPYTRDEATEAVTLCGGEAYIGASATEDIYKKVAPEFDIIHLAMHTLLNNEEPLYSKMVFASSPGSSDDGLLNTYEVYNIPLKARMVVLSSCNTGSGKITSGEGIQSLARGFISSGGKSVIMSMWEVEDYAGSEVIKLFYKNIIRGNTKSQALRKARLSFLRKADQQRSHPYYWSTLVVYGDDAPLYYSKIRLVSAIISLCLALSFLIFIFYRDIRS